MTEQFSVEAFVFILILIIYILTAHLVEVQKIPFLHESGVAIILGFLTAILVNMETVIVFDNQVFFTIILPPIIFSAGYSLRKSLFFQNLGMISFLGIAGTIIGFVMLSLFTALLDNLIFHTLTLKEIMLMSSVLCATDTVAAMSLIKPQKFPVLNAVLFGEGIINDAVAIVLFRTVSQLKLEGGITFENVLWMIFDFVILTVCSLAIGAAAGFGLSYLLKVNQSFNRYPIKETSLILLTGYVTYLLGQLLGFSGIITLFTCSIIMGHYTFMNISEESQRGTGLAFETVSYIAQAFVYAYLGACVFSLEGSWLAVGFSMMLLLFLPFVRAIMVYTLPAIYYCLKKPFPLKRSELKVCWYSGLVRGVIAFALALQIETQNESFISTVVLVIVMLTTLFGASLLKTFCECIGLKGDQQIQRIQENYSVSLSKSLMDGDYKAIDFERQEGQMKSRSMKQKLEEFQNQIMKPIFKKSQSETFNYDIEMGENK